MGNQLIQIISNYFCAGILIENGYVIETAPILKYMKGWTQEKVVRYCQLKGFLVEFL